MQPPTSLSSSTENSNFICDHPIAHLCGLESRYALAVGDYAHQVLSTVNVSYSTCEIGFHLIMSGTV